ncbi:hypothetical protein POX_a01853 [Penicillium oxalicum]|uniref:Uncharacterized protein n=1 Tax=Penicillium oxalicum (strain 114-2 / CGMCC 5302) TaxID=933388 RepID=S8BDP8_PENO1|nr:hypothetical protein POX_a01853 [Penicillium oxalicum]EPS33152.1 hypothetical protein PDE_08114 [Penicillium oxalicum 114-2]KAI2795248.1 hypothetical protein POX_a01853 [Penicillium oxalicum]
MKLATQASMRSAASLRAGTSRLWSQSRSSQKRFASAASEKKGGMSRPLLVVGALAVPAAMYMSRGNESQPQASVGKEEVQHPGSKSMHPYMGEPGKSTKGEGVTDTAKLNGTVRVDRPAT